MALWGFHCASREPSGHTGEPLPPAVRGQQTPATGRAQASIEPTKRRPDRIFFFDTTTTFGGRPALAHAGLDGRDRQVLRFGRFPSFSPDGRRVAWVSRSGEGVFLLEDGDPRPQTLFASRDVHDFDIFANCRIRGWSPDSRYLLVAAGDPYLGVVAVIEPGISQDVFVLLRGIHSRCRASLWIDNSSIGCVDSSGVMRISDLTGQLRRSVEYAPLATSIYRQWQAGAVYIWVSGMFVFHAEYFRDGFDYSKDAIFVYTAGGSDISRLSPEGYNASGAVLMPGAEAILFSGSKSGSGVNHIFRIGLDGKGLVPLLSDAYGPTVGFSWAIPHLTRENDGLIENRREIVVERRNYAPLVELRSVR